MKLTAKRGEINMNVLSQIMNYKIIRGSKAKDVVEIAKALNKGGIRLIEVAMNSPKALNVIEQLSCELGDEMIVGAGTVLDPQTARNALIAGAKFILSPTVDKETIKMTKRYGAVSIPGAFTPTEILNAFVNGGDIIKVFPASSVGPSYIKDIKGPLNQIPLLPTGGINLDNIDSYIKNGAAGAGVGGSLVNSKITVNEAYLKELTVKASEFVNKVNKCNLNQTNSI
jgi:2-dehydro-3-deoxyphosphogluconate aldolase/(4S)-4-hydroxy-2-oxoglutarate aldolase